MRRKEQTDDRSQANIAKDAKIASFHLPAGRSAMAGILSYLGIERKDENGLSCYGRSEMDIPVTLAYTGIAERHIAELCRNEDISPSRLNSAYQFLESLPYKWQLKVMDKVVSQRPETFRDFRNMLDSSALPTVVTKFYCPLAVTLYVRNKCLLNDIFKQIVNLLLSYLTHTHKGYIIYIPCWGIYGGCDDV